MANLDLKPLPKLHDHNYVEIMDMFDEYESCQTWCDEILGYDAWNTQRLIMDAISKPGARVAVKACHASGKTSVAARIALWFTYTGGVCITTAPTWPQVEMLLWKEIHEAYHASKYGLGGELLQTNLRVDVGSYAFGLSTNEGVRFQGFHARQGAKMLVILDEAPGVKPMIWEAIEGIRSGGDVRILVLGNPVMGSGPFYNAFNRDREIWQHFTIDAFDSPNLKGLTEETLLQLPDHLLDNNPRPYLTTRRWVKERLLVWGIDSPIYQSRVRGRFPTQGDDALFDLTWLEQARVRMTPEPPMTVGWWAGIDVAGPGESETVVSIRHGSVIKEQHFFADSDPRDKVLGALEPYRIWGIQVNVDSIGQGYYFARHLEDNNFTVHDINVGSGAIDNEKYTNLKAESYWSLREILRAGVISGLTDDETIGQLTGIRYLQTDKGKIQIESKVDAAKRGVPSPDRAESLMLAFLDPTTYALGDFDGELAEELANFTGY